MTATPTDLSKYTDEQLRALSLEVVNELLRRGVSIEEICKRSGAATTEDLWKLLGFDPRQALASKSPRIWRCMRGGCAPILSATSSAGTSLAYCGILHGRA